MIKILERYIAKTIISATAIVALIFMGVISLMSMTSELKNIGKGDYGLGEVIIYVLLRLPNEVYQFAPMLILLGSIMGLSILSSNRELSVMRASGYSIRQIIRSVLGSALLLILVMSVIGEGIAPSINYYAEVRRENVRNADQAIVTSRGMWYHVDNNFIHIEHAIGRQLIMNVSRYQFDDEHRLQKTYFARAMAFQDGHWHVGDVVKTTFYENETKSETAKHAIWNIKLNPALLNISLMDPSEMSLLKILKFSHYLKHNGLQTAQYLFNFWQRVFQPLASLVMIFLAVPFVLGAFGASTTGWRIVFGVVSGFAFYILNSFFGQLCIVFQVPVILAASLPLIIFSIFGAFLAKRLIRH